MSLRNAIQSIVREMLGSDIRRLVKEILLEELEEPNETPPAPALNPRSEAAKRAAAARVSNQKKKNPLKLPKEALNLGLEVGQSWTGKPYMKGLVGRVIEITSIDATGCGTVVKKSNSKHPQAKHVSFERLRKSYVRVTP